MGRTQLIAKYEITPQIKELQRLAMAVRGIGVEVNIDITQDLVTINGFRKTTYAGAKEEMENMLESNKTALTTSDYPDQEQLEREAKAKAKAAKKHREPGAPPELKAIIRRSKRIYKKATLRGITKEEATTKAKAYFLKKSTAEDLPTVEAAVLKYIETN